MGVRANHEGDLPIKHTAHGNFFRCRLRMKIKHDNFHFLLPEACDLFLHRKKGIFERRLHKCPTLCLNDCHFSFWSIENDTTISGSVSRVIDRTEQSWLSGKIIDNFALVPDVISSGDDGSSRT